MHIHNINSAKLNIGHVPVVMQIRVEYRIPGNEAPDTLASCMLGYLNSLI